MLFLLLVGYYLFGCLLLAQAVKAFPLFYLTLMKPSSGYSLLLTPRQLLVVSLLAMGGAALHWQFAVRGAVQRILSSLGAHPIDESDRYHKVFDNIVQEMGISAGGRTITPVVLGTSAMNAFTVGDPSGDTVIGVTEGLLARLTRNQLQAVVAHEMAHIVEADHVLKTIACSLFGVFAQMLEMAEQRDEDEGTPAAFFLPALWLVTLGAHLLKVAFSREREYLADATAVELTRDPLSLAEALHRISRSWKGGGFAHEGLAPIFIMNPRERRLDEEEHWFADLFSTHPPIHKRLDALLEQAHLGLPALQSSLKGPRKEEAVAEGAASSFSDSWMAYDSGTWKGPFTAEQLMELAWFSPDVWIWRTGVGGMIRASEDQRLGDFFKARLAGSSLSDSSCPRCKQPLRLVDYEGTSVQKCWFCGGTLVEKDKLARIIAREEKKFTPRQLKSAREWETKMAWRPRIPGPSVEPRIHCPRCKREMHRRLYSYQYFIPIDYCFSCHWIWFDKDELALLQIMIEKHRI